MARNAKGIKTSPAKKATAITDVESSAQRVQLEVGNGLDGSQP
jgi:hypothetical protein